MSGLLGIEAIWKWTSPDGTEFEFNRLNEDDGTAIDPPRFRLTDEPNHGYPAGGDSREKKVGATGSTARPDYRGDRLHTFTIEVYGATMQELRANEETLRAAFLDQSAEGRMDCYLHPDYPGLTADEIAAAARYFNAKALDPQPAAAKPSRSPHLGQRRSWVVPVRNHDGRYFENRLNLATNPKAGTDVAGWDAATLLSFTRVALGFELGGYTFPYQFDLRADDADDYAATGFEAEEGVTYHASAWFKVNTNPNAATMTLRAYDEAGVLKATSTGTLTGLEDWERLDVGFTADSDGEWTIRAHASDGGDSPADTRWFMTGVLIEPSDELGDYFDGDSEGAQWEGDPDGSISHGRGAAAY